MIRRRNAINGKQWRERLALIGLSAPEFARHLRRPEQTINRWIAGTHATPREVEILLDLLCRGKISLEDLR